MVPAYTSASFRGGTHLPQRYAGSRSDSSEPIPMVQRGCPGPEERRYSAFLCGLQVSMDLKSGFWQIKMALGSQQYTAFMVGNLGFYEFTRMLFGLCNAPVTFQHLMQNTLGELNLTYCVIYLDDIMVSGCTEEEHLECLRVVFERFREFKLKPKPSKCSFFQSEIVYLAHHVSRRGILPSWENVVASGPKTDYVERDWRWSGEPER